MIPYRLMIWPMCRVTKKTYSIPQQGAQFFTCAPPRPLLNSLGNRVCIAPNIGVIAQLGERLNGIQEVRGSIPRGSTKTLKAAPQGGGFWFFGHDNSFIC